MTRPMISGDADRWILPLAGNLVTQCTYDFAFAFVVGEVAPKFSITIEESFTVRWAPDTTEHFDPEGDPAKMAGTLSLLRRRVERSHAFKDGRLEVDFEGGVQLFVAAGTAYEPWHVNGPDSYLMVSVPGGGLTIWS